MSIEKQPIINKTEMPEITHIGDYQIKPERINGIKINFVGVEHTTEFLNEHRDKFENPYSRNECHPYG